MGLVTQDNTFVFEALGLVFKSWCEKIVMLFLLKNQCVFLKKNTITSKVFLHVTA